MLLGCQVVLLLPFHCRLPCLVRQSLAKQKLGPTDLRTGLWVPGGHLWCEDEAGSWAQWTRAEILSRVEQSCPVFLCILRTPLERHVRQRSFILVSLKIDMLCVLYAKKPPSYLGDKQVLSERFVTQGKVRGQARSREPLASWCTWKVWNRFSSALTV